MAKNLLPSDPALLSALLEGLQMSRQRLDAQIDSVKAAIAGEPETEDAAKATAMAAPAAPRKGKKGRKPGRPKGSKNAPKPTVAAVPGAEVAEKPGRRKLSASARKAIAIAQRRRWEEFRKNNPK